MESIKKVLPNIDIMIILTILSYGIVYSYNVGMFLYLKIPTSFIELGINNLTGTLMALGLLLCIYVPTMTDLIKETKKRVIISVLVTCLITIIIFYVNDQLMIVTLFIVFLGSFLILLFKNQIKQITLFVIISLYAIFSVGFIGYMLASESINIANEHFILNHGGKTHILMGTYKDNYIVTELNKNNNQFRRVYQLIPITASNENKEPIIIEQKKLKLIIKD